MYVMVHQTVVHESTSFNEFFGGLGQSDDVRIDPCDCAIWQNHFQGVGSGGRLAMARDATFEQVEVVADGHSERQQFFEPLLRFGKIDRDAARFEPHAGGEVFKLLIQDGCGGFDQQLGLSDPLLAQVLDEVGHFAPALDLIRTLITFGDALEACDESIPIGEPVCAGAALQNARRQDLLGTAAADAQQEFEGGAVHIRKRVPAELLNNGRQFTIPDGFGGHDLSICYCAPAQNTRVAKAG